MDLRTALDRFGPRRVHGISAVLLPYTAAGTIDWTAFERLLLATSAAGLDVAVNMDTGFGDLLAPAERRQVLDATRAALGPGAPFYAGAYTEAADVLGGYHRALAEIEARGGIPVVVQCRAMHGLAAPDKADLYRRISDGATRVLAFELGAMFAAHGEIWDDDTFARVLALPRIAGSKHSSLDRGIELRRLAVRDRERPDFRLYTGNDLAIDMVAYGSDYLLGLSAFAPAAFAARDRALADGDLVFLTLNDNLQHLGNIAFRHPVPAYKHAAALYLQLTGVLHTDHIHPRAARRPASERVLLLDCARRLGAIDDYEQVYRERVAPYL